jgi:hypothetical protein
MISDGGFKIMRTRWARAVLLIAIVPVIVLAADDPERIRKSEINKRAFAIGELELTVTRFWPGSLLTRGYLEVKIQNKSNASVIYDPQRLSFVTNNDRQVNIRGRVQKGLRNPDDKGLDIAQPRDVAPRAYIKEFYELDGRVRLPARLIYEGKELALITD